MRVEGFTDVERFLERTEETLLRHEAENSLILGIALRLREGHTYGEERPLLASVESDDEIAAIALQTPPHNILLRAEREDLQTPGALADYLAGGGIRPAGVHAERGCALGFADVWGRTCGCRFELAMDQRLYRLTSVTAPADVSGRFRLAEPDDLPRLATWVDAFVSEAIGEGPHPDPVGMVARLMNAHALAVWDDDGPVSMASNGRPTKHGIAINLVYTPPEQRGRGYATACVAELSRRQLEEGRDFCTLFADLANPTSNTLYQRVGYRPIADFAEVRFAYGE
jgi:predicted GNAT family acetyltransferase